MSKYSHFRKSMNKYGENHSDSMRNRTKIVERRRLLNSPTKSYITINDNPEKIPVIISEDDRMKEKRFLFLPDTHIETGWLIKDGQHHYLAVKRSDDDIYPQLFCELCNHEFIITTIKEKTIIGYNDLGYPEYDYVERHVTTPSVLYTNVYSTLGNSVLSLPSGALKVRIPYKEEYLTLIKKNAQYTMNTGNYKITEISRDNAIYDREGYLEISLQREVD